MGRAELIERWFAEHDGEEDFFRPERSYPYSIVGPDSNAARIIYLTKSSILFADEDVAKSVTGLGAICRCGLPNDSDIGWLRDFVGTRELLFVGDLDPVDILTFAWLGERLQSTTIKYVGIGDQLTSRLNITVRDNFRIQLGSVEEDTVATLAAR